MRIDRTHFSWLLFVTLATVVCGCLFLANFYPQLLPFPIRLPAFFGETPPTRHTFGGTPLGLIFGSVAFAIFLFASALGIRKKKRLWPIGNVRLWLKAHIWLTVLTIPLVLFHCGFRSGGLQTSSLFILYVVVMVSGFFGLALQQFMPKLMKEHLTREVVFEQIPHFRALLVDDAGKLRRSVEVRRASTKEASHTTPAIAGIAPVGLAPEIDPSADIILQFLDDSCLPYLEARRGDRFRLADAQIAAQLFRALKFKVAGEWQGTVEKMQGWCEERRLMDLQTKYQHWLHGWLIIHVPTSFALLILTGWHGWVAVRFLVAAP